MGEEKSNKKSIAKIVLGVVFFKFHIFESDSLGTGNDTDVITIDVSK